MAAECDAAIWIYRKQAAARSKERASAAQLVGFRRLAVIIKRARSDDPLSDRTGSSRSSGGLMRRHDERHRTHR